MNDSTENTQRAETNTMGVVGLILSCIGLMICIFSLPGLIVSVLATRRQPRTAAVVGVAIGGVGVVLSLLWIPLMIGLLLPALAKARGVAQEVKETNQLSVMHQALLLHAADDTDDQVQIPDDVQKMIEKNDAWGNAYRIDQDGHEVPKISSAGPDGVHDTEDDIHSTDFDMQAPR